MCSITCILHRFCYPPTGRIQELLQHQYAQMEKEDQAGLFHFAALLIQCCWRVHRARRHVTERRRSLAYHPGAFLKFVLIGVGGNRTNIPPIFFSDFQPPFGGGFSPFVRALF